LHDFDFCYADDSALLFSVGLQLDWCALSPCWLL